MTTHRAINSITFLCSAVMLALALYMEHVMYLEPCPLCMVQRLAVIAVGVLCLIAALHNPGNRGRRVYGYVILFAALFGVAMAGRHVYLQSLPSDRVPECFPGIEFIFQNNALMDALSIVLSGTGECAETLWTFLGISIPGWTLMALCLFVVAQVFLLLKLKT